MKKYHSILGCLILCCNLAYAQRTVTPVTKATTRETTNFVR